MSEAISILQLGKTDWRNLYKMPENIKFHFVGTFTEVPKKPYDIVFLDREIQEEEYEFLMKAVQAYTLFVTNNVKCSGATEELYLAKKGKKLAESEIQSFLLSEVRNFYPTPYGEKFQPKNIAVAQGFSGSVRWDGNYAVTVQGDFGEELNQIIFWRNNIPVFEGQAIDLWLEYKKSPDVEIALVVTQFYSGSLSEVQQKWVFLERELDEVVTIDNQKKSGPIFVSLIAKGKGTLQVIALHDRYSRRGHGYFLPGGERYVTSDREEVFCYFNPGDRKPPLSVYFSGYKTRQGFEGYNMMQKMGSPFLLIAEPRLEGGSFYMGSEEYENMIKSIIQKYMNELCFSNEQVIMSGLSMGTFGALYYGCDIRPHALILGKPLTSIGDVAENERLHRPNGFPTSLDVLQYVSGSTDKHAIQALNDKFWVKFDATDWRKTKFIVSYMIEDDYDTTAYGTIISHLHTGGAQVYGKGIHGRHNDATGVIVKWYKSQYISVLNEDFGRRVGK